MATLSNVMPYIIVAPLPTRDSSSFDNYVSALPSPSLPFLFHANITISRTGNDNVMCSFTLLFTQRAHFCLDRKSLIKPCRSGEE